MSSSTHQHDTWFPKAEGMYDPALEHDACGVGMVANIDGTVAHEIIETGLEILVNLTHRGAVGSDPDTGDGAGILMQLPHAFFARRCGDIGIELPEPGAYAAGMVFLPRGNDSRCIEIFNQVIAEEGCRLLGWRDVPHHPECCGRTAASVCPEIKQVFIGDPSRRGLDFERKLYVIRRLTEKRVKDLGGVHAEFFYVPTLSSRTICYKGMMLAHQVAKFYPDLREEDMQSALAVVHQRYSTNTFPSWPLAQPFRCLCHNGEINTLRGNINKMLSRHSNLLGEALGEDVEKLLPIIIEGFSDSACFDNMLEFLYLSGREMAHAILMMIPEAWGDKYYMGHDRRGFYEFHANFMEPWDGPAAILFTDGTRVGGILDRNGLRPSRYTITRSGRIILGSETGVADFDPEDIESRGRLQPGKMMLVDTEKKRVLFNDEIKAHVCRQQHYRRWVDAHRITFEGFGSSPSAVYDDKTLLQQQIAFGFSREDVEVLIRPMANGGAEPIGSMGNDTPPAVLSDKPQLVFSYFKQLFAQVTNPAIDPIREELVMSLTTFLGSEGNILEEKPEHARRLKLKSPIITTMDLQRIRDSQLPEFRAITLDALFDVHLGEKGLEVAMENLFREADAAIDQGYTVIVLSDRSVNADKAPIPSLLAVAGVHHHLIRQGTRNRAGLIVESGEPREVNHFALLCAFGAQAIKPYVALQTVSCLHADGALPPELSLQDAVENYIKAVNKGILKILSKMGISTLRSYGGAQIFECVGFNSDFVEKYFTETISRVGGIGIEEVARESLTRHREAFKKHRGSLPTLPSGGQYAFRRDGERHLWTPETIHYLQQAVRREDRALYDRFAEYINRQERRHVTLRSLFDFDFSRTQPIPLDEVEPAAEIVKRFNTGAMSFGSLSREVHETMAVAMNRLGGSSNSGEGGEDSKRFVPLENGDSKCSMTKQIASGRFGVTGEYLANARELQIKIAQGAKPGEGGHLPGHKVNVEIATVRNSTPGVSLISPPPHHDIYSIEDLAQLIFDLKNGNPEARISVKLVSECGVGTIAAGVAKGHADMVLISGGDGGTGASPLSSIKHAGLPWELGLAETHQTLVLNDLRGRIRVQTDGQMRTGRDVAVAALLGAEEYGFGTAALITLGCVMMRKCHMNTCPVGVATQDPRLRERFAGKPEHLQQYLLFVAEELRETMATLGFRSVDEMIGRSDRLKKRDGVDHWKARSLDFSGVFHRPKVSEEIATYQVATQDHGIAGVMDHTLIEQARSAIDNGESVLIQSRVRNTDRTVGAMLSYRISKKYGGQGLPEDTVTCEFKGSAGQSFGCFLAPGVTFRLEGDANDYVGKGLSGGKLIMRPPHGIAFDPAENVIVGNTVLYGATDGECYFNGLAGERFAVRNSGAHAVVEGVGDHGCEYMTGGLVVVLGTTGVNFAAGMSGGIAYVYDPHQDFDLRCNLGMVDLDPFTEQDDIEALHAMIRKHHEYTDSARAAWMLQHFDSVKTLFVKVFPIEYRRALGQMKKVEAEARKTEAEKVELA